MLLTMDDPTATLMLSVSWSLTETLTAVTHSVEGRLIAHTHYPIYESDSPAIELTTGKRISPIHSLLSVGERLSMESTSHSELIVTSYRRTIPSSARGDFSRKLSDTHDGDTNEQHECHRPA